MRKPTAFYVSSYFWDRATDAGIIADEGAITWTLKPSDLSAAGEKACSAPAARVPDLFPKARPLRFKTLINPNHSTQNWCACPRFALRCAAGRTAVALIAMP